MDTLAGFDAYFSLKMKVIEATAEGDWRTPHVSICVGFYFLLICMYLRLEITDRWSSCWGTVCCESAETRFDLNPLVN